ncbi:MAG: cyclase family protein [Candidatus Binatia bacterium]|nr:cyclase family protein [Candidatus Binatia bacterium]
MAQARVCLSLCLFCCAVILTSCSGWPGATSPLDAISAEHVVDLTHSFGPSTIYWPTGESFQLERLAYGKTDRGYWYAANKICLPEHGGTHMDAPIHFAEGQLTADAVPLRSLIGPAAVIDVRGAADNNRDYEVTVDDILQWERRHGRLPEGAIVVFFTGWSRFWGDKRAYLGSDKPGDVYNLHFPGLSAAAAEFLTKERTIAAVAIDTASIDPGPSLDFLAHQILNGANKPAFENLTNLHLLPPTGAILIALPMKIQGGSGGPARIIAVLPHR